MVDASDKVFEALNRHISAELSNSHEYLAASAFLAHRGLEGMAKWLRAQSEEERGHAMRFHDHVLERGGRVRLGDIRAPPERYDGPLQLFQSALKSEQETTARISGLYEDALANKDYALHIFLQWFIQEQVKEEAQIQAIVDRLNLIGDDKAALVMLDADLGQRSVPA